MGQHTHCYKWGIRFEPLTDSGPFSQRVPVILVREDGSTTCSVADNPGEFVKTRLTSFGHPFGWKLPDRFFRRIEGKGTAERVLAKLNSGREGCSTFRTLKNPDDYSGILMHIPTLYEMALVYREVTEQWAAQWEASQGVGRWRL